MSHDWLGPVLAAAVSLSVLLTDLSDSAILVVVAVATCFGWSAVARALLAGRRLEESRRAALLRWVCVAQCLSLVVIWGLLMMLAQLLAAAAVLVVGVALSAMVWPWRWRLQQAVDDRGRGHDTQLGQQHLMAAGILLVLAAGSAVALSGVACAMLLALAASSVVDACEEWRRPKVPETAPARGSATATEPRGRSRSRASARSRSKRQVDTELPVQRADEPTERADEPTERADEPTERAERADEPTEPPARASHRRGRRSQPRYSGRRVASRRP